MRFDKTSLKEMPGCYATTFLRDTPRPGMLFATEAQGPCYRFDYETLACEQVWSHPGGTMSLVALGDHSFLASQKFLPVFQAQGAQVVHAARTPDGWRVRPLGEVPYVHRFDVLRRGGVDYLLCCALCGEKADLDDWSAPGSLLAGVFARNAALELREIAGGMTRNHGYCRLPGEDGDRALVSCDQGVYEVIPPQEPGREWAVRRLLEKPVSDIAVCDIDADGVQELMTIEPFHGDAIAVYRPSGDRWECIYRDEHDLGFSHVAWGGRLRGTPVFLGGCRAGGKSLFLLRWQGGKLIRETIETGMGPSNIAVHNGVNEDRILVANREAGECAMFTVTD